MPNSSDKYRELIKKIFDELIGESPVVDELLMPMRIYINDIDRFSSPVIFLSKFREFIESRDERLVDAYLKKYNLEDLGNMRQLQDAINKILDSVLERLGSFQGEAEAETTDLKAVIEKVRDAKTLNNLRKLSDVLAEAGQDIITKQEKFHAEMSKLNLEVSIYKRQIEELEGKLESSRHEAEFDHLTGLRNRRVFDRDLRETMERAKRLKTPLSLLLLDIDHFKHINDKWGHAVGDDVLVNFSKYLCKSLRDFDLTYRLGGDEFAVLFTRTDLTKSSRIAERVRAFVATHNYRIKDLEFRISLSGGLTQMCPNDDEKILYERADKMLYKAKNAGRDRIFVETDKG